jgi:hypothetical protein
MITAIDWGADHYTAIDWGADHYAAIDWVADHYTLVAKFSRVTNTIYAQRIAHTCYWSVVVARITIIVFVNFQSIVRFKSIKWMIVFLIGVFDIC